MGVSTNSINIDIGGTFTDCYVRYGNQVCMSKAPTTTYDLSVSFMKAIEEASKSLGTTVSDLFTHIDSIRYSTTLAMNRLIERKGPKLCLVTTQGFEDLIFMGRGSQWQDGLTMKEKRTIPLQEKPQPLIPRDLVIGVRERIDSAGKVVLPLDENDFRQKLNYLVDRGVRGFVVCLLWSPLNSTHEQRIKAIIEEEYPDFYLGGLPVVLSSEVLPKQAEYIRCMTSILNAYLHQSMVEELAHITDRVRDLGYKGSVKMVHNTGGMAESFSTTAVQTYNGGPVAGLIGGAHLAKLYGNSKVIVTDMGGTSFDLGVVVEGNPRAYTFQPVIDRWLVGITTLECRSIGAGGGSIAWIDPALNRLQVGPQSAGAMPGPACYDQGGEEPTTTDADLVLGYINPDNFHGGKLKLNKHSAQNAIRKIARHFGVEVEQAAFMIKRVVDGNMGNMIYKETVLRGFDPREFTLFAYGGAGPTHCCGYGDFVGVKRILVFPYSPAFCAFGSSLMNVVRFYEQAGYMMLMEPATGRIVLPKDKFNSIVKDLQERAKRDLMADGVRSEDAIFELELDMKFAAQIHTLRCQSPRLIVENSLDAAAISEEFIKEYADYFSPVAVNRAAGITIINFALRTTVLQDKPDFLTYSSKESNARKALIGNRPAMWDDKRGFEDTRIYSWQLLECGNVVQGPAIIEAPDTTIIVSPEKKYTVDKFMNGVIEAK